MESNQTLTKAFFNFKGTPQIQSGFCLCDHCERAAHLTDKNLTELNSRHKTYVICDNCHYQNEVETPVINGL